MNDDLESVELAIQEQPQLPIPLTGELVDLTNPSSVANALENVRDLKRILDNARAFLEDVLRLEARKQGTKTLHLDGLTATISGGEKISWDALELREQLRQAGMPDETIAEIVVEEVSYKVDGYRAKRAAGANLDYRDAIEACQTIEPAPWRVTVKPR